MCGCAKPHRNSDSQFARNYNKLRAIIQAYLNSNKSWIVNNFRESDPMDVNHIRRGKSKGKSKNKSKGNNRGNNGNECHVCGKKAISHETVGHEPTTTNR